MKRKKRAIREVRIRMRDGGRVAMGARRVSVSFVPGFLSLGMGFAGNEGEVWGVDDKYEKRRKERKGVTGRRRSEE